MMPTVPGRELSGHCNAPVQVLFYPSTGQRTVPSSAADSRPPPALALSDGEIDFLWWFIQGSIMDAGVRIRLYAHWGMCARHALGFFCVEAAFRPHLIHGSTILYNELMRRASHLLEGHGVCSLAPTGVTRHRLRSSGPCHMCNLGYGPASSGNAPPERIAQGRDLANARAFARANRDGWLPHVCGQCAGTGSDTLCRRHLIESPDRDGALALRLHGAAATRIAEHLARFEHSFRWDSRGTDSAEDRGALIAAIGWCSGWGEILQALGGD
ncbi:hypothetical protein B0G62_10635 [Paraburkholderia eburnea]|uniref:Uncharacterized protein n=1 Tax=Paraburkholderia eburnea TaxID=1189126 RepID=A0A2S4M9T3_9BURK|nr:hypothetical protein B0G62_10635 [Paraburkholderia eburnea]PRZ22533.1 hypothetical protein BX588_10635 [Paraburkholderia eburnea]